MNDLARMMAPLARGIRNSLARGVLRLVDDARKLQEVQIEINAGEILDGVEHWHSYGLSTHPHPGAEALVVCLGGSRSKSVVVACADRRYRLTGLAAGEVAIHDDQGQVIKLSRTGIEITAPMITLTGAVTVTGTLTATGVVAAQGGITMAGGTGETGQITGNLSVTGSVSAAAVTAGNIGLGTHHHPGTGGPLP